MGSIKLCAGAEADLMRQSIKFWPGVSFVFWLNLLIAGSGDVPSDALLNLASPRFCEREIAQTELLEWARTQAGPAMNELLSYSQNADDPEVRERCLSVLRILVIEEYLKEGEGYIGIGLADEIAVIPGEATPRELIRVLQVQPNSPAERAGIRPNDLIVRINREMWHETLFRENVRMMRPNTGVDLKLLRDGEILDLKVTLARRPLSADTLFFNAPTDNSGALERAAEEAYFRRWLSQRKTQQ